MGKQNECFDIFNQYVTVLKEFEEMAFKINELKASVQNPDFIDQNDFKSVASNNASVLSNLQDSFNKCYGKLLDLFERVAAVYGIENVEEYK